MPMINRSQASLVSWPSNSSFSVDDSQMDKRSLLEVHQFFFDKLNTVAGLGRGVLKGHWLKGLGSADESAIRESMDAALCQDKWTAVQTLSLYAKTLTEQLPASTCCFAHTDRVRKQIALRLGGEDLLRELSTLDLDRGGVNVIGDENLVSISGDRNSVTVIGHRNQVTVNGHHNQVARTSPDVAVRVSEQANPGNADVLVLRENVT